MQQEPSIKPFAPDTLMQDPTQTFKNKVEKTLGQTAAEIWSRSNAAKLAKKTYEVEPSPSSIIEAVMLSTHWYICDLEKHTNTVKIYCLTEPKLIPIAFFAPGFISPYKISSTTKRHQMSTHSILSCRTTGKGLEDLFKPPNLLKDHQRWTSVKLTSQAPNPKTNDWPHDIIWVGGPIQRQQKLQLYQLLKYLTNRDAAAAIVRWTWIAELANYEPTSCHCIFHKWGSDTWNAGYHIKHVIQSYWKALRQ